MSPLDYADQLAAVFDDCGDVIVACSGGIDSLLLATLAHRHRTSTVVAHTVTPAVPSAGTARVLAHARREQWNLEVVRSNEFDDERYLSNPTDRCYFCKTNLYDAVAELQHLDAPAAGATILSGANLDDLGEYRPGLIAADEHQVRHPYIEADMGKAEIRALARHLGLDEAELPAEPCLASRLYTGTRVTEERLRAIELGEAVLREVGHPVVRCRVREYDVLVEVPEAERGDVSAGLLNDVLRAMQAAEPDIRTVKLDDRPYRPGQAVLQIG